MSDIKHSPLPWAFISRIADHLELPTICVDIEEQSYFDGKEYRGGIARLQAWPSGGSNCQTNVECKANAEFIIRACNSHYELIEALADCRDHLQDIASGSHSGAFEHELVDAANLILAKAKGDSND